MQSPVSMKCSEHVSAMATLVVVRLVVICYGFLLLINGVGVSSVTKRCVHSGEAIKLFSDTGGKCEGVSMYDKNQLFIASWSLKDGRMKIEYMDAAYSKRIYMDGNRNVWFLDVEKKDARKYVFKCGIQNELELELTVLEKLTEEQLQECPNKCPGVSKMDFETMTTMQVWERYTKGISYYITTAMSKEDDKRGGSHSETDHRITAILVIVIIWGIFLLVIMIMGIWFACNMWNKTKLLTEDQVQKWLHDHPGLMEKNLGKLMEGQIEEQIQKGLSVYPEPISIKKYLGRLSEEQIRIRKWIIDPTALTDQQDSTEDHRTVSSQVTPSIVTSEFGIDDRLLEVESVEKENQNDFSVKDKISLFEQKCNPHEQPKVNRWPKMNVRSDRCFTSENHDVGSTNPLL